MRVRVENRGKVVYKVKVIMEKEIGAWDIPRDGSTTINEEDFDKTTVVVQILGHRDS